MVPRHRSGGAAVCVACSEGLLKGVAMIVLGIILIVVGLVVASLKFLLWIGLVLLVLGLFLNFVPIGGRRRRFY